MNLKESYIIIEKARFYAYHGVLHQEKVVGNEFLVSLKAKCDIKKALQTDNIEDSVSYALILDVIKKEMKTPSSLIENLAYRISKHLFDEFEKISQIEITIEKISPPMNHEVESAAITLCFQRE